MQLRDQNSKAFRSLTPCLVFLRGKLSNFTNIISLGPLKKPLPKWKKPEQTQRLAWRVLINMGSEDQQPNIDNKLPILIFSKDTLKPGTNSWLIACKDVQRALEEYGCFIVLYHQVPSDELNNAVFGALEELFDLPTETKMKNVYDQKPLRGYVGQIPKLPLHESLGIYNATALVATQHFTNTMWPGGNQRFW